MFQSLCTGYIYGAAEAIADDFIKSGRPIPFCPGEDMTNQRLTDLVVRFLQKHTELDDEAAPTAIGIALTSALPCKN